MLGRGELSERLTVRIGGCYSENMPVRKVPLVEGQIYHVFNKSIDEKPIFVEKRDNQRVLDALWYYRFKQVPLRLSYFLSWPGERRGRWLERFRDEAGLLVKIISFVLMPNHFHLLLEQVAKDGISKFLSQLQNSYTRFFNTKKRRKGHLFLGQFKAIRMENEEQFIHTSRYIHLNPYTSFVVKKIDDLLTYPWSSFPEYLGQRDGFCTKESILSGFGSTASYRRFVFDQADYQRELQKIKHLTFED